ncbi:uncharacterized protein BDR25DRAFT_314594 [Lindgomyces ingoldianus]|uniref:Uncharacterized protein n=1 Tax=Lindgomyces ingoldianus TaxID=673940 RepID=A0ACB6QTS2_9PLEO|nr:uncharacterized protein BDR25DRAFT_314594 [Lindgomyces ingoldianus]KAF2470383.1 hypothetical protein BDR25DRAFT_314594 [Lindgomyces ingoldianus]
MPPSWAVKPEPTTLSSPLIDLAKLIDAELLSRWQSPESERIFLLVGVLITNRRNKLQEDIIEAHECLSSWDRAGLVTIGQHTEEIDERDLNSPTEGTENKNKA